MKKNKDRICTCDYPLVSVDTKTGIVRCFGCGGIKEKPKGKAITYSELIKKINKVSEHVRKSR